MGAICRSTSVGVAPDFTAFAASEPSTTFSTHYVSFANGNCVRTIYRTSLSPITEGPSVVESTSALSVRPRARERSFADDALPVLRRPEPVPQSYIQVTTAIATVRRENAAEMVRHGRPAIFAVYYVCGRSCDPVT